MAQWSVSKASLGVETAALSSTEGSGWSCDAAVSPVSAGALLPHTSLLLRLDLAVFPSPVIPVICKIMALLESLTCHYHCGTFYLLGWIFLV